MLQAKHRRVLWLLLLIWLQLLHSRLLEKLMDDSFRSLQLGAAPGDDLRTLLPCFWLAGALCMVLWQFGSYQRFRRKAMCCLRRKTAVIPGQRWSGRARRGTRACIP